MRAAKKFERAARLNRVKAAFITILFHVGLLAGIAFYNDISFDQLVPEKVKTWLGMEQVQETPAEVKDRIVP